MFLDLSNQFDLKKAETYFEKLKSDGAKIELKKVVKSRTVSQNSYLHVCLTYFSQESGYEVDELKELFSHQLPEMLRYTKDGHSFRRSTSDLSTVEMAKLITHIREVANAELGLYIPQSEEYLINKFQIDKELNL